MMYNNESGLYIVLGINYSTCLFFTVFTRQTLLFLKTLNLCFIFDLNGLINKYIVI